MINNYYPLYLYTIGFLFLLLFLLPPFSLSLSSSYIRYHSGGTGAHTIDAFATRAKLNCVGRERTSHFCALCTKIDARTLTADVTLISEKLSKANKSKN